MNTAVLDQINSTSVTRGQLVAFKTIETLQGFNTGDQLVGSAMLLLMMCERFKVKPRDLLYKASHVLYDSLLVGTGEHTRAIQNYMNMELN